MNFFLGIDTSNYTTSVALCNENGEIVTNEKKLLPVAEGERGLRQSDALFNHTVQLPELFARVESILRDNTLLGIGVSTRPRDAEGSYMPCFLAGKNAAYAMALGAGCNVYEFSHQCGHLAAALYSSDRLDLFNKEFCAFHVSGGTTDILHAVPDGEKVFSVERIGGTLDLNAGQVIDRTGVMLGMRFPCGPALEKAALSYTGEKDKAKICVKGLSCNLSGAENKAKELYEKTGDVNRCAAYTIGFIEKTVSTLADAVSEKFSCPIVFAGGVMSCSVIKNSLSEKGSFAAPAFSSDNAAGIALMARNRYFG